MSTSLLPAHRRPFSTRLLVAGLAVTGTLLAGATPAGATPPSGASTRPMAVLYVSPTGDDANPGTNPGRPLRTLEHARDLVRQLDQHMSGDIVVELEDGTFRLPAPLELDARDSGTGGHEVVWKAAPGANPVLSGGRQITGWQPPAPGSKAWTAPIPAGLQSRQLYVDGVRAQRASGVLPVKLTATATGYTASSAALASWRNPSGIEFVYTGGDGYWGLNTTGEGPWTEPRCPVASISGTTVTMAQPCWDNSNKRLTDTPGHAVSLVGPASLGNQQLPAYAENAAELLDQPGEWYLDPTAHIVSYIPRPGDDMAKADVEIPVLETLVSGHGTAAAPIHDIAFHGIQFSYATWLAPSTSEGFSEIQANYRVTGATGYATQGLCGQAPGGTCPFGNWTKTPGNISFHHDRNISFISDAFVHLGAAGLDLGDGSQYATVQGSTFTDISGNALEIGGVDQPQATGGDRTSYNTVADNHFYSVPVEFHGGVAIDVGYAEHTLITHNQIDHTAYSAISIGWGGWLDKINKPAVENYANSNTISDNRIDAPMQLLADGGAIYSNGTTGTSFANGEHVTGNVITGATDEGNQLYCDNGCNYWTASQNVLIGSENNWGYPKGDFRPGATGATPMMLTDNYWQQSDADSSSGNVTVVGNHLIASLADAPASIVRAAGLRQQYRHILDDSFGVSVPGAPTQTAAVPTRGAANVAWNAPIVHNGTPVTQYTVTASPGGQSATISAADFERLGYAVVTGLSNGTAYTFTVTATNRSGTSAPSLPTPSVTPTPGVGAVPPSPTTIKVSPADGLAGLQWSPPASHGGTPITGYTITGAGMAPVHVTGHSVLWSSGSSTRPVHTVLGGLDNTKQYTFQLTAENAAGSSAPVTFTVLPGPTKSCKGSALAITPSNPLAQPGSTVRVTATLTNNCAATMQQTEINLFAPEGYVITSTGRPIAPRVPVGQTASQTWDVRVPTDATSPANLTTQALFSVDKELQGVRTVSMVNVPWQSLQAAFNNVGITDDTNTGPGDIDGYNSSFSAQALAAAGVTPGSTITHGGLTFTWPSAPSGQPDNVNRPGQAIKVVGSGSTLGFLLTGTLGPVTGSGEVVYSDGSIQPFTLTVPDWYQTVPGSDIAIATTYRNRPGNTRDIHQTNVYYAGVHIDSSKSVADVILPQVSSTSMWGTPSINFFAIAVQ